MDSIMPGRRSARSLLMLTLLFPLLVKAEGRWVRDAQSCSAPRYPRDSLARHEEGTTSLRILVGADGKVIDSEIEGSSRYPKLDEAAQRAMSACSYRPVPAESKPGQQWIAVRFEWKAD